MKIVIGESTNPYFNLAMEEYFLKEKEEDYFMLWRNDKSVIIGKNQNAYAEINQKFVSDNNIKVVRRVTGGGAVFHDLGNINYTFIKRNSKDSFNDYKIFSQPIIDFFNELGVKASMSGRNDILIGNKKISGNAQCAYKDSVMHHGTLLFSSDKTYISDSLNVNPLKIKSKGISSVRSRVTNISEHLNNKLSVESFISDLCDFVKTYYVDSVYYRLSDNDRAGINELVEQKYSTDKWNYGFKQEFSITNEIKFSYGLVQLYMTVTDNKIEYIKFLGDFFGEKDVSGLEEYLVGKSYLKDTIKSELTNVNIDSYITGMSDEDLLEIMF